MCVSLVALELHSRLKSPRCSFAHLCLIAQNAETSKMNLRNLGIVFAPTLAIPQPLFSLFLVEFDVRLSECPRLIAG